jgi:hypothetical protein
MSAAKYSFIIEQGATLNFQIDWADASGSAIDLSGYSARMQIRPEIEATGSYLSISSSANFNCLSYISLSGSNFITPVQSGSVAVYLTASDTMNFNFDKAFYDLEMVKGCEVTRLIEGLVHLSKNVTR